MSWFNRIRSTASKTASNVISGARRLASTVIPDSVQRKITDFGNWLTGHVRPEQTSQVLAEIVEHVRTNYPPRKSFEVGESDSALEKITRVYTIEGVEGYDARRFLQDSRQNETSVLRYNRKSKIELILKCYMERQTSNGTIIRLAAFHSYIEVTLDGTDEKELYDTMVERMIENMATFQSRGSSWRLHSII